MERTYICPECGAELAWESEWEDSLVCLNCGFSIDPERYGLTDEEYEDLYPTMEQVLGIADDDEEDDDEYTGETYDEVCGELDD